MKKSRIRQILSKFLCTAYRNRTGTNITARGILSPLCLPISPRRHFFCKDINKYLYLQTQKPNSFNFSITSEGSPFVGWCKPIPPADLQRAILSYLSSIRISVGYFTAWCLYLAPLKMTLGIGVKLFITHSFFPILEEISCEGAVKSLGSWFLMKFQSLRPPGVQGILDQKSFPMGVIAFQNASVPLVSSYSLGVKPVKYSNLPSKSVSTPSISQNILPLVSIIFSFFFPFPFLSFNPCISKLRKKSCEGKLIYKFFLKIL